MNEQNINMRANTPIASTLAQQGAERVACYDQACNWSMMAPKGCAIVCHTGGCVICDPYLNHIMHHIEQKSLDISPVTVEKGLCDTWPVLFEQIKINAQEEGRDSLRPQYNCIVDELKKLEFKHKIALKEHTEALKNADKINCKLHEKLAAALAGSVRDYGEVSLRMVHVVIC
jgi:hypothetical protein